MAYEIGTATDYLDLLRKLRTFLTTDADLVTAGQEWTEMKWVDSGTDCSLYLRGQGNAGLDEIYVNIGTQETPASSVYHWYACYATGFNTSLSLTNQPGSNYYDCRLALWNSSIPYWFIANGRCFKVIAKVSTTYHAFYGGFFYPYATASEYPYPIAVGGSVAGNAIAYSGTTDASSNFWDPAQNANLQYTTLNIRATDGAWLRGGNRNLTTASDATDRIYTAPWAQTLAATTYVVGGPTNGIEFNKRLRPSLDGTFTLKPVLVYRPNATVSAAVGELDGVYYVSGFGNTAENVITISGVDYLVVPNVYRSGENDYAAFKLEA